jgi:hypothetical protein
LSLFWETQREILKSCKSLIWPFLLTQSFKLWRYSKLRHHKISQLKNNLKIRFKT